MCPPTEEAKVTATLAQSHTAKSHIDQNFDFQNFDFNPPLQPLRSLPE
ncbi:MAG: hypothetical protein AAFX01_03080 [Cyanobacteria bacterium J06638_28]